MSGTGGARADFISGEPADGYLLAERLAAGFVPLEQVLCWAAGIGRALHRAHTRQLVHGSLSPFSVALGPESISILDPSCPGVKERAAAYRAPEQVRGEAADWRSDIFSFGAVLYELAYGRRAFAGEGAQLEQAILECAPVIEDSVPPGLARVIAGCLQKDPSKRRQRVHNAVIELKLAAAHAITEAGSGQFAASARPPRQASPAAPAGPGKSKALPAAPQPRRAAIHGTYLRRLPQHFWIAAIALFLLAATVMGAAMLLAPKRDSTAYEFAVAQPDGAKYPGMPAISPDGRLLAWSAAGPDGKRTLWLRALDDTHAYRLENTDGAFAPFWSPDSQYIGYFANQSLAKIRVNRNGAAGSPETLCAVDGLPGGGSWSKNGQILFASGVPGGLYRIGAGGGAAQPVTQVHAARGERSHLWPQFLPDGEHFIFFVLAARGDRTGIYAGSFASSGYSQLISSETSAVYSAGRAAKDGYLLFIRNRRLMGQPFDAAHLKTHDDPVELGVAAGPVESLSLAQISVSGNGILVYQSVEKPARELVWVDRAGKRLGSAAEPGDWGLPRISPDGKRIVAGKRSFGAQNPDLWVIEADGRGVQITNPAAGGISPVWSPDGSKIVFASNQRGGFALCLKAAAPGGTTESLYRPGFSKHPDDWSRDGRYILYSENSPDTVSDIFALDIAGRKRLTILDTIHYEGYAALTRDQKWLAYQSDEDGDSEVYVQPFENASSGTKRLWRISSGGGGLPRWRADGNELFYMTIDGRLMAAAVHVKGGEFSSDPPRQLFQTRSAKEWNLYDAAPDGQRFLVNVPMEWTNASPITVTTGWDSSLSR